MTGIEEARALLHADRPLLLLDADNVLLQFVESLEDYLLSQGAELRLTSFQLGGNIYMQETGEAAPPEAVRQLISSFFDACVDHVPLVDGVSDALSELSDHYQIAILSNVPSRCRERRETSLKQQGIDYPVIANKGDKGPVARLLAESTNGHVAFVDDLPPQISSVAAHAPDVHRVHFVADPRLAGMIGKAPDAHARFDDWPSLVPHLIALGAPR